MLRDWWRRLWGRKPATAAPAVRVVIYTRTGCHLCDLAAEFLETRRAALGFTLDYVDIDRDPDLVERHGDWVPVVEIDGQVRFRGRIDPVLWHRLETALARR